MLSHRFHHPTSSSSLGPRKSPNALLVALSLLTVLQGNSSVRAGQDKEAGPLSGPIPVISTYQLLPGDVHAWWKLTFYNPTGLRATPDTTEMLLMFVQSMPGDQTPDLWEHACGDTVILFETPWTHEGLRSPFSIVGRISPCICTSEGCPGAWCDCSAPEKLSFGVGSALRSNHDDNYYIFLDKVRATDDLANGDFFEVIVGKSANGRDNWEYPANINPLLRQSTVPAGCTENCEVISVFDVTLTAGDERWWGFFKWAKLGSWATWSGRIRVLLDASNPTDLQVEILSGGLWQPVNSDGTFDFMPDEVSVGANSIVSDGAYYQAWSHEHIPDSLVDPPQGCNHDEDPVEPQNQGSRIYYSEVTEGEVRGGVSELESRIRPNPSLNVTGRAFPFVLTDDEGDRLLYSASSDTTCEAQEDKFYKCNWCGIDIVLTYLSDSLAQDRFTTTTARPPGTLLDNTATEIGERTWAAHSGLVIASDYVTVATSGVAFPATIPVQVSEGPVLTVEADVDCTGTDWVGVGLSSMEQTGFIDAGQVWMYLHYGFDQVRVFADGLNEMLYSGPIPHQSEDFNRVELSYVPATKEVVARVNGTVVLQDFSLDSLDPPFEPNIQYAGFQFRNASAYQPRIDNFAIKDFGVELEIFQDGFESGDTSEWSETVGGK